MAQPNSQAIFDELTRQKQQTGQFTNPFTGDLANFDPVGGRFVDDPTLARNLQSDFLAPLQNVQQTSQVPPVQTTQTPLPQMGVPTTTIAQDLAGQGIATSALPEIISQADLVTAEQRQQIEAAERARAEAMKEQVAQQFGQVMEERRERGEQEIGGAEARLGITRGLGASSSRMQFINQMQQQVDKDINTLTQQMVQAQNALDFEAADRAQQQINELTEQRFKLQQVAFNQAMDVMGERRAAQRFGMEQAKFQQAQQDRALEQLNQITSVGGEVSDELRGQIESVYGAGFTDALSAAQEAARVAESEEQQLEAAGQIVNIISKIPAGQQVQIGDSVYEGIKTVNPNTQVMREVDAQGNVTVITVDKVTGEIINQVSAGRVGKGFKGRSGGGGGFTPAAQGEPTQTFAEWIREKERVEKFRFDQITPEMERQLIAEYEATVPRSTEAPNLSGFSKQEKLRLEQAGLINATRQEQLDFLFGDAQTGGGGEIDQILSSLGISLS